mgnify:CR=1 FL=1
MNFDQNTLLTVLAVLKVLEANFMAAYVKSDLYSAGSNQRTISRRSWEAERVIGILNNKEKEAFRAVMLSMVLNQWFLVQVWLRM